MKIKNNEIEISLEDKVVKLRGHQDDDVYRIFTESLESHPELSSRDKEKIKKLVEANPDIIID